jgi:hypothetical protein
LHGSDEGRSRAGARAEEADRQIPKVDLAAGPIDGRAHSWAETVYIEAILSCLDVDGLFDRCEQVEQQRREPLSIEELGDLAIAPAAAAAAAAVGKDHEAVGMLRHAKVTVQAGRASGNLNRPNAGRRHRSPHGLLTVRRAPGRSGIFPYAVNFFGHALTEQAYAPSKATRVPRP